VTHHVDISWNENWTGTHQVRNVRLDGDKLYISTNPQSNGIDGKIVVGELVWEKVKSRRLIEGRLTQQHRASPSTICIRYCCDLFCRG
jgi:hypothetical protein